MTPQRRADDVIDPHEKQTDRTLAILCLAFSTAFFYQLSEVLSKHACWCDFAKPAGFGEILFALVCGLVAIGTALGLDVPRLLKGFGIRKDA